MPTATACHDSCFAIPASLGERRRLYDCSCLTDRACVKRASESDPGTRFMSWNIKAIAVALTAALFLSFTLTTTLATTLLDPLLENSSTQLGYALVSGIATLTILVN